MHPIRSNRRVHSAEFKARVLSECRQPGASISAVAIAHGLNTNVVRKWLAGRGLKRMGAAVGAPATEAVSRVTTPALQFVPVELARSAPLLAGPIAQPDIRIEVCVRRSHIEYRLTM